MDSTLLLICIVAATVSMLSSLGIAARPAAARTSRVMLAFTIASLCFLFTRFANLFYGPLLGKFVDAAERTGNLGQLESQLYAVLLASALGTVAAWALLPSFVELYQKAILSLEHRGKLWAVLFRLFDPSVWRDIASSLRPPGNLGVTLFQLQGVPKGFLVINIAATAIWSVGLLAAILVSAQVPEMAQTAVLLSGAVNAMAAIAFSVWVDPQAAIITDQAVAGERPKKHIDIIAVHLALGNILGGFLGLLLLHPAAAVIRLATRTLGSQGEVLSQQIWPIVLLNLLFALLASTTHVSRVSAVRTKRAATAVAVFNLFFLVARMGQQVISPLLGSLSDFFTEHDLPLIELAHLLRVVLFGTTLGSLLALLLLPSLIALFDALVKAADRRGSLHTVLYSALNPKRWMAIRTCFVRPSLLSLSRGDLKRIPRSLVLSSVLVVSTHTVGLVAAVYAGAVLPELQRTASLLSSVVNGFATVLLGILIEPSIALMTEEALREKRPTEDIYALAFLLVLSMFVGTLLSQCLMEPAKNLIVECTLLLDKQL